VPDEHLAGYCHLQEAFNSEAPLGDLDIEPEVWDAARVREREDLFARAGRYERATAALAPDGTMVALTEMMTTAHGISRDVIAMTRATARGGATMTTMTTTARDGGGKAAARAVPAG